MTRADINKARAKIPFGIAVSGSYHLYPEADILYSSADDWWDKEYQEDFKGLCLGIYENRKNYHFISSLHTTGFGTKVLHTGTNSGFAAVNLALLLGMTKVYLLGFDMRLHEDGRKHYFGNYEEIEDRGGIYEGFIQEFEESMADSGSGIPNGYPDSHIINLTSGSGLSSLRFESIEDI